MEYIIYTLQYKTVLRIELKTEDNRGTSLSHRTNVTLVPVILLSVIGLAVRSIHTSPAGPDRVSSRSDGPVGSGKVSLVQAGSEPVK